MSKTEQPPAGEFTKEIRDWYGKNLRSPEEMVKYQRGLARSWIKSMNELREACNIIDRSEASREALLTACEKVQKWLDTSSLQQVLVHYTEDERRHALIMGIATNLERLKAAIAKEKEVKK